MNNEGSEMKKYKPQHISFYLLLCFFILWSLLWVSIGAYFSFPNAEDLFVSTLPKEENGFLVSIFNTLLHYDGRYFTNILHAVNPLVFDSILGYKLMPILGISLFTLSIAFLIKSFFKELKFFQITLWSLIFGLLPIIVCPSISHLLYWMISSFVYFLPWSIYFLWIASMLQFFKADKNVNKNIWFTISVILLICSIGINEMFLPLISVSLLGFAIYSFRSKNLKNYIPILLIGLCSIYLFISSPGIEVRMESMTETRDLSYYIEVSGRFVKHLILFVSKSLFFNPFILLFSLLFYWQLSPNSLNKIRSTRPICVLLAAMALLSMLLPYYIGMGVFDFWPARIYNSFLIGFISFIVFLFVYIIERFPILKNIIVKFKHSSVKIGLTLILIMSLFFFDNNIKLIYTEYSNNILQDYNKEMTHRYAKINAIKTLGLEKSRVTVPLLQTRPISIFNEPDLQLNRTFDYWHIAYEEYFEIDQIRLEEDNSEAYMFHLWYQNYTD